MTTEGPSNPSADGRRVPVERLRWRCDPTGLDFETTSDLEPLHGVVGQDRAVEALRFGIDFGVPGQNIYVRGLTGTGRMTLVRRLLEESRPSCPLTRDRCYVHDFGAPERPRLITLASGQGPLFRGRIDELVRFITTDLVAAMNGDAVRGRQLTLEREAEEAMRALAEPFDEKLRANGLALVTRSAGAVSQPMILPLVDGEPVGPEDYRRMRAEGAIDDAADETFRRKTEEFAREFESMAVELREIRSRARDSIRELLEQELRALLMVEIADIRRSFPGRDVGAFLDELVEDVAKAPPPPGADDRELDRFRVNVISSPPAQERCPIEVEIAPTMRNLLGTIDQPFRLQEGPGGAEHMMIRAGSLLRAEGGFLIVEVRELLAEPGAWRALVRTLRTGRLEIVPPEARFPGLGSSIQPEPIDVQVKVILIGDAGLYYLLDQHDQDFPHLFKVLVDFDTVMPNDGAALRLYGSVLARVAGEEGLAPFDRTAVAALAEHGARMASRQDRLTTRFGRLADVAREASWLARQEARDVVVAADVSSAIDRGRRRADLPARRFRELIADGTIGIRVDGTAVGQVNGLAVIQAGPLVYGFPSRITATIGPGSAGTINIERESQLSGAIHTKGFYILGGLLRHLLPTEHPLAFSASVAFEQSYGGIDGDSASGAEACCLLSALAGAPLRQDLAMTGAIDQHGHIQPVGGVTEKIEGFFDACRSIGLTGTQGVLIPAANVRDLMLHPDVVAACERGEFNVWSVTTIAEALEILTGEAAGKRGADGRYPQGTLLGRCMERARAFWRMAVARRSQGNGE